MKLQVGKQYQSKAGNVVEIIRQEESRELVGLYKKVIEGHEALLDKAQLWSEDGKWVRYPDGIHDLVKEV